MYLIAHKVKSLLCSGPPVGLAAFLFTLNAVAASIVAQDQDLIYFSDGRVEFVSGNSQSEVKISSGVLPKSNFDPTVLSHMKEAHEIYQRMRIDFQEQSQCTNLAHVWAYEEFKKTGIKTQKMFLFFTKKYIMEYRFPWWFHVAPMVTVKNEQVVLDRRYTTLPLNPDKWAEHFVLSGRTCKEIQKFSTFWNRRHVVDDCFFIKGSMYDWQPRDLRLKEQGTIKRSFRTSDLDRAYQEAF